MKQLSIFEELDHIRDEPKMVEKHYLNTHGEPLPWEEEEHILNCKKMTGGIDIHTFI